MNPTFIYCKCLTCQGRFSMLLTENSRERQQLEAGYCLGCQQNRKLEWEFALFVNEKELVIHLIIDKCPNCSESKVTGVTNWDELVRNYGNEENFPQAKEQIIEEIDRYLYLRRRQGCQCSINDNNQNNTRPLISPWKFCPFCRRLVAELFENNQACDACARKEFFWECKDCKKKFRLDNPEYADLPYPVADEKAKNCLNEHERNECPNRIIDISVPVEQDEEPEDIPFLSNTDTIRNIGRQREREREQPNTPNPNQPTPQPKPQSDKPTKRQKNSPPKPNNPLPNYQPQSGDTKKYGDDFISLKAQQQEQRKLVIENWDKNRTKDYWRKKFCPYCQKDFQWNNGLEYLKAEQTTQQELDNHKSSCSLKNNRTEQDKRKQEEWNKDRKSKDRVFASCKKCKGKVIWDKSIGDYKTMIDKLNKEFTQHQKECENKPRSQWTIKVYASPSSGSGNYGNLPAGTYSEQDLLALSEKDNQGEVYQEQTQTNHDKEIGSSLPWIIGIGIILMIGLVGSIAYFKKKNQKKRSLSR